MLAFTTKDVVVQFKTNTKRTRLAHLSVGIWCQSGAYHRCNKGEFNAVFAKDKDEMTRRRRTLGLKFKPSGKRE